MQKTFRNLQWYCTDSSVNKKVITVDLLGTNLYGESRYQKPCKENGWDYIATINLEKKDNTTFSSKIVQKNRYTNPYM